MNFRHVLLALFVLCLAPALFADDFKDFRIPPHHVFGLSGRIAASGRSSTTNPLNARYNDSYWNGSLYLAQFWLKESDKYRSRITSNGSFSGNSQSEDSRISTSDTARSTGNAAFRALSESLSANWSGWAYPWHPPVGLTGSVSGYAYDQQSWNSNSATDHYPTSSYSSFRDNNSWNYHNSVTASVGIGYGRVRDATGVYDVYVAEQRLRDLGVITGTLSPETRKQLAELYYRRSDFKMEHERSNRFFWRDVDRLLRGDPAVNANALDAYSLYRIAEPIYGGTFYRERGFFVGPVAQGSHYHDIYRNAERYTTLSIDDSSWVPTTISDTSYRHDSWTDRFFVGGQLEYHLPINPLWQVDLTSEVLVPARPHDKKGFTFATDLNVTYVIADRWRFNGGLHHQRDSHLYYDRSQANDGWTVGASAALSYFIEDRTAISGSINHTQAFSRVGDDYEFLYSPGAFHRETYFSLSVVYHFAGIGGFISNYPDDGLAP